MVDLGPKGICIALRPPPPTRPGNDLAFPAQRRPGIGSGLSFSVSLGYKYTLDGKMSAIVSINALFTASVPGAQTFRAVRIDASYVKNAPMTKPISISPGTYVEVNRASKITSHQFATD